MSCSFLKYSSATVENVRKATDQELHSHPFVPVSLGIVMSRSAASLRYTTQAMVSRAVVMPRSQAFFSTDAKKVDLSTLSELCLEGGRCRYSKEGEGGI